VTFLSQQHGFSYNGPQAEINLFDLHFKCYPINSALKALTFITKQKEWDFVTRLLSGWEVALIRGTEQDKGFQFLCDHINLLLTEREGRTGEYWPEVAAVWTSLCSVHTKTTEGQYSSVRLKLAQLVS